jgi:hypothetical protein
MSKKVTVQMLSNCQYRKTGPKKQLAFANLQEKNLPLEVVGGL